MIVRPLQIARPRNNRRRTKKSPNVRPALHSWPENYCKTGNFRERLIFANFAIVIITRKLIFVNIFAHHYNMSTARKKQIFKTIKFQTIKIAKFYSSEIKWVYSIFGHHHHDDDV